jgi:flagellar operon protein (TIGR03826 family)
VAIANCKRCGRIYNRVRRDICPACIEEEDKIFVKVRNFLREHKNAYMDDVIEGTGVDMETLIQMIQDGRVILSNNPNMGYACERCGGITRSGRFCAKCTTELARTLAGASAEMKKKTLEQQQRRGGYYSR